MPSTARSNGRLTPTRRGKPESLSCKVTDGGKRHCAIPADPVEDDDGYRQPVRSDPLDEVVAPSLRPMSARVGRAGRGCQPRSSKPRSNSECPLIGYEISVFPRQVGLVFDDGLTGRCWRLTAVEPVPGAQITQPPASSVSPGSTAATRTTIARRSTPTRWWPTQRPPFSGLPRHRDPR